MRVIDKYDIIFIISFDGEVPVIQRIRLLMYAGRAHQTERKNPPLFRGQPR